MDGAVKQEWLSTRMGTPDGMREGSAFARAADHNRAQAQLKAQGNAGAIKVAGGALAQRLVEIFDLGGMDAAENALAAARAELARRRRPAIEKEGWVV